MGNNKTITLKHLKTLDPCSDGLYWYAENIQTENSLEVLLQLNDHRPDWSRWLMVRLLNKKQNQLLSIFSAELVLHIYEEKYPNDKRVRECIQAAKDYLDGKIDIEVLISKRRAIAADAVAYAADAAAYAADAVAYAVAYAAAAYAADAADAAADAAAYAAGYAADAAAYAAGYAADAAYKIIQEKIINEAWRLINEIRE